MVNGKMPLYLTALTLGLIGAALIVLQPYSADWPGTAYAKPARDYIRAARRQDSAALVRLSVSSAAVRWALDAGRVHGDSLEFWEHRLQAWTGQRRGDTTEVFVYPSGGQCGEAPIVLEFVGRGGGARVVRASSLCWCRWRLAAPPDPRMQPTNAGGAAHRAYPSLRPTTTDYMFSQVVCSRRALRQAAHVRIARVRIRTETRLPTQASTRRLP